MFRTPGYPLVLAPLFLFSQGEPPVYLARALSAVLGTIAVGGVYRLGTRLFDRRAGLLAAALAAIEPGSVAAGVLVLSEAPFVPLMILQIGLWIAAWNATSVRRGTILALAGGIGRRSGLSDAAKLALVHALCRWRWNGCRLPGDGPSFRKFPPV